MVNSVKDENGKVYQLGDMLGSGGQGAVFSVKNNNDIVIKVMTNQDQSEIIQDEKQWARYRNNIRRIIGLGEFEHIAVPTVMLEKPFCGYVMLFMSGMQSIDKLMQPIIHKDIESGKIIDDRSKQNKTNKTIASRNNYEEFIYSYLSSGGLKKRLLVLAQTAKVLAKFEDKNVVYCDISPNNVYVSTAPESHEAWLIDLDNLNFSTDVRSPIGTPKYMAPEVVKGKRNTIFSDRYSFALVAYQTLFIKYPFAGVAQDSYVSWEDDADDWSDDGEDPFDKAVANGEVAWIFEMNDTSNRPQGSMDPQKFITKQLFNLFERSLNKEGRNVPTSRPSMHEWFEALTLAAESLSFLNISFTSKPFLDVLTDNTSISRPSYFVGSTEPFKGQTISGPVEVNIFGVDKLIDEETEEVAFFKRLDKTIIWNFGTSLKLALSNFDVLNKPVGEYDPKFFTFRNVPYLPGEFSIDYVPDGYECIVVEDNQVVQNFHGGENQTIYIKRNGEFFKILSFKKGE